MMPEELDRERRHRCDFALLVVLAGLARLMPIMWFTPIYSEFSQFFFPFAALSEAGAYPFVDYWLEYPPVFPWLSVAVYKFAALLAGGLSGTAVTPVEVGTVHNLYVVTMQVLMATFETANIVLIYAVVRERWDRRMACRASWIFALLFYPTLVTVSYFDGFVLFWLLLSIWLFLRRRPLGSAAILAVGVMAKIIPVVFLPVALKYLPTWRRRLAYLGVFFIVILAIEAPFLLSSPRKVATSYRAMARRKPWETVWALFEGYYGCGVVGPGAGDISDGARRRWEALAGPKVSRLAVVLGAVHIPQRRELCRQRTLSRFDDRVDFIERAKQETFYLLMAVPFLFVLGYAFWRGRADWSPENILVFALAATCLFMIYSKGWSPQFLIYPLALCLFGLGRYEGPVFIIALSLVNYVEMPLWLVWPRLAGGGGHVLLEFAVAVRTVLLLCILYICLRRLCPRRSPAPSA